MQAIQVRIWKRLLIVAMLMFAASAILGDEVGSLDTAPSERPEPAWLTRRADDTAPRRADPSHGFAAWRSMGALLLVVGALVGAHYFLRRREPSWTRPSTPIKVVGRMRLGFRQDLIIVEWDNEQLALAVGSSFIRCLHVRQTQRDESDSEPPE